MMILFSLKLQSDILLLMINQMHKKFSLIKKTSPFYEQSKIEKLKSRLLKKIDSIFYQSADLLLILKFNLFKQRLQIKKYFTVANQE